VGRGGVKVELLPEDVMWNGLALGGGEPSLLVLWFTVTGHVDEQFRQEHHRYRVPPLLQSGKQRASFTSRHSLTQTFN